MNAFQVEIPHPSTLQPVKMVYVEGDPSTYWDPGTPSSWWSEYDGYLFDGQWQKMERSAETSPSWQAYQAELAEQDRLFALALEDESNLQIEP